MKINNWYPRQNESVPLTGTVPAGKIWVLNFRRAYPTDDDGKVWYFNGQHFPDRNELHVYRIFGDTTNRETLRTALALMATHLDLGTPNIVIHPN